jgi:nitrogen fixation NifU-like protein
MSDLRDLYQEVILDHSKRPRNFRELPEANHRADGYNPLCGDRATVYVRLDGDIVTDVSFKGSGCSISTASASMMTEALKGKTRSEADALFERFHRLITSDPSRAAANVAPELGKLAAFSGVCEFPVRVKCASLPWHTLRSALEGDRAPVSTEETEASRGNAEDRTRGGQP